MPGKRVLDRQGTSRLANYIDSALPIGPSLQSYQAYVLLCFALRYVSSGRLSAIVTDWGRRRWEVEHQDLTAATEESITGAIVRNIHHTTRNVICDSARAVGSPLHRTIRQSRSWSRVLRCRGRWTPFKVSTTPTSRGGLSTRMALRRDCIARQACKSIPPAPESRMSLYQLDSCPS
jgi:hypothetical protein